MNSLIVLCLLPTACLTGLILSIEAAPDEKIIGVEVGDYFLYSVSYSYESNDPDFQPWGPTELDTFNITVVNKAGYRIEYSPTACLKNGSCFTLYGSYYIDVQTGETVSVRPPEPWGCFFANLSDGDLIFEGLDWRINETVSRAYPSGLRDTNYLIVHYYDTYYGRGNVTFEVYIDRMTGVLVEMYFHTRNYAAYSTEEYITYQLIDANLWVVPEFPSLLILPIFMITALLIVAVGKRKHFI